MSGNCVDAFILPLTPCMRVTRPCSGVVCAFAQHVSTKPPELRCALPRSWDQRLVALQDYYGNPGAVMPFHFLNPGGYIGNVSFWLHALKDYQLGQAGARYHAHPLSVHAATLLQGSGQQPRGLVEPGRSTSLFITCQ